MNEGYVCPLTGIEFVFVKGGYLWKGDTSKRCAKVKIEDFFISKYLITENQWIKVFHDYKVWFTDGKYPIISGRNGVDYFIKFLNKVFFECKICIKCKYQGIIRQYFNYDTKFKPICPYRLPTGDEWEYAAKSGEMNNKWAGTDCESDLHDFAWFDQNLKRHNGRRRYVRVAKDKNLPTYNNFRKIEYPGGLLPFPVGMKKPNFFGIYDMSGNVAEYVSHDVRGGWLYYPPECITTYFIDDWHYRSYNRYGYPDCSFRLAFSKK